MTKDDFIFNLKRCGCLLYKDGNTYYEENELIKCFEDVGAFNQSSVNPQEPITDRIEYGTDGNAYRLTISNGNEFKQEPKTGHCKDCKHFEYDSVAKVDGIPLIIAHEICNKWGDGCKTKENGYCFLFEPKMQEVEE